MDIILIIGNCQVKPIAYYLKIYFGDLFNIIDMNIINDLTSQNNDIDKLIKDSTFIISQHFYDIKRYYNDDVILQKCNNNIDKIIYIHSLYFTGYHPDIDTMSKYKINTNMPRYDNYYLDYLIKKYNDNDEIISKLNIAFNYEIVSNNLDITLKNLYDREMGINPYKKIDVPIYDFIKNNYKTIYLFNTINHPTNYLLNYYSYIIFNYINNIKLNKFIDNKFEYFKVNYEFIGNYSMPIFPSVYKLLNLEFIYNGSNIVGNKDKINLYEYINEIRKNMISD